MALHYVGKLFFRLLGWKVSGVIPGEPKLVIAAAPHTSNMDGFFLIAGIWYLRIRPVWMIKKEWSRGPLKWVVKWLGGLPVDRSASLNIVDEISQQLESSKEMLLIVAPEGTRRKTRYWKSGFYWIAYNADVPILCAGLDYKRKLLDFTFPLLTPTGNIEADMEQIWGYFRNITGKHPENVGEMRLRPPTPDSSTIKH